MVEDNLPNSVQGWDGGRFIDYVTFPLASTRMAFLPSGSVQTY